MDIKFTEQEIEEIKKVVFDYHQLNMVYNNYTKELERIKGFLEKVNEDFKKVSTREKNLMESLHKKYGDFSIQEVFETIIKHGTESDAGQCEVETGENTQV